MPPSPYPATDPPSAVDSTNSTSTDATDIEVEAQEGQTQESSEDVMSPVSEEVTSPSSPTSAEPVRHQLLRKDGCFVVPPIRRVSVPAEDLLSVLGLVPSHETWWRNKTSGTSSARMRSIMQFSCQFSLSFTSSCCYPDSPLNMSWTRRLSIASTSTRGVADNGSAAR